MRLDLFLEIREDFLRVRDGPALLHGLQGFRILIPTRRDTSPTVTSWRSAKVRRAG